MHLNKIVNGLREHPDSPVCVTPGPVLPGTYLGAAVQAEQIQSTNYATIIAVRDNRNTAGQIADALEGIQFRPPILSNTGIPDDAVMQVLHGNDEWHLNTLEYVDGKYVATLTDW